jgi:hypothetical protein
VHGDALGEGPHATVARPPVDLVTHGEARHGGADVTDDAGEVVAEYEGRLVGEDELELAVADLRVEQVDAGGVDVDEHVVVADRRFRSVAGLHRALVLLDAVSLHRKDGRRVEDARHQLSRNSRTAGTNSRWYWKTPPCPESG